MVIRNGKHKLVGFVDLGETHNHMEYLTGKIFTSYLIPFDYWQQIIMLS